MSEGQKNHFINFFNSTTHRPFNARGPAPRNKLPKINPQSHGAHLKAQYNDSWNIFEAQRAKAADEFDVESSNGITLVFQSTDELLLQLGRLNFVSKGIELRSVKMVGCNQIATVYIPDSARMHFLDKIDQFIDKNKETGNTLYHVLGQIQAGTIKQLWTEPFELPAKKNQKFLWEVWLVKSDNAQGESKLKEYCRLKDLYFHDSPIHFEDRTVLLVSASVDDMEASIFLIPELSELRKASQINADFTSMQAREKQEFIDELLTRIKPTQSQVLISLFDTGVKREHSLLKPFIRQDHLKSVNDEWCLRDLEQHGTPMAGLAVYGNLTSALNDSQVYEINHSLESVKIYHNEQGKPELIPEITQSAFDLTSDDEFKRIYVLSLTQGEFNFGMPTSQSAVIDKNTFGYDGNSKLMIIATGNRQEGYGDVDMNYLNSADDYQLEEPSQSWNALVVGGYTQLTSVSDQDFKGAHILAEKGELGPNSRVSTRWNGKLWPIKPEIVMESGNCLSINDEINSVDDLSLLTTSAKLDTQLECINGTSAASAQAANFCADILTQYPDLRAETIKGLIVHTADWTDPMWKRFQADTRKTAIEKVLRTYGYGVPNLQRALYSLSSSVTLILEDQIVPFAANNIGKKGSAQKINEWNVHDLPWPKDLLEEMGAANVKLTVTLCYFIEPHASRRGFMKRYQYNSHGLKFKMKAPGESPEDFRIRVNKLEVEGATPQSKGDDSNWLIGPNLRSHTTCQKDIWEGSAIDLADKNQIGIYPVGGWWKEQGPKDRDKGLWGTKTHYSLILSITSEDQEIDLYSEIENQIDIESSISVKQDVEVDGS